MIVYGGVDNQVVPGYKIDFLPTVALGGEKVNVLEPGGRWTFCHGRHQK